jgi:MFS superfamily sulfate permease-like transporter
MHRIRAVHEVLEARLIICLAVGLVRVGAGMSDWAKDWRKWSRAERALAIALIVTMMVVLPLGLVLGIARPGI